MTAPLLTVARSHVAGTTLELLVECPQASTKDALPDITIFDMLGRPILIASIVPAADVSSAELRGGDTGEGAVRVLAISAVLPKTAPDADPPSYGLTVGAHSTWFVPSSPRALPKDATAVAPPPGGASIDYLGRDYTYFTSMMRSRVSQVLGEDSAWALDQPADPMTTILETLAYAGDHLSFRQDAAGTEAYLPTARHRLSLRRHARLRDYLVDDGCNARTALVFEVNGTGLLPAGLQVVTLQPSQPDTVLPAGPALAAGTAVFETMQARPVSPPLNDLGAALQRGTAYTIPADTISLTLAGTNPGLLPGQLLVLQQSAAPAPGTAPFGAQVLRLLKIDEAKDQGGAATTVLSWHPEDALTGPLTVPPANAVGAVSLFGNVVLADHGMTVAATVSPDTVAAAIPYRPVVRVEDVVSAAPPPYIAAAFDGTQDLVTASLMVASATASLAPDPQTAAPSITMIGARPAMTGATDTWTAQQDLLSTAATGRSFAAALEDGYGGQERRLVLRFGEDGLGYPPAPDTVFAATVRTGNGQSGRVRAQSLLQVIGPAPLVVSVSNPLPALPSTAEGSEAIRLFAATHFRTNLRGIVPDDWERIGYADPLVADLRAGFGPDGSAPCTVTLTAKPTLPDGVAFPVAHARLLEYAVLGAPPDLHEGDDAALDIVLVVYCRAGADIGATRERLFRRIGAGTLLDGTPAFFNPVLWPFGRAVRLDELVTAIKADPSVAFVVADPRQDPRVAFETIAGADTTAANIAQGFIDIALHQRVRIGNDAFRPALGSARLYVVATS